MQFSPVAPNFRSSAATPPFSPSRRAIWPLVDQPHLQFSGGVPSGAVRAGGVISMLGAVGAAIFAFIQYNNQVPHALETRLGQQVESLPEQLNDGILFDAVSGGMRRGAWRMLTGNEVSQETRVRDSYKLTRNAQNQAEDLLFDWMEMIALSANPQSLQTIRQTERFSIATRNDYHDVMEDHVALEAQFPPGNPAVRAYQNLRRSQIEDAYQKLDQAERDALLTYIQRLLKTRELPGAERVVQWKTLSADYIDQIVGKYQPSEVEATKLAVSQLFDSVAAQRTLVDQERAARNTVLLTGTGGLGALGLLLLVASSMAVARKEGE